MKTDVKEEAKSEQAAATGAPTPHQFIKFPEDQIRGDGFTQLDPNTGWLWVGINLRKFTFRDAWAFIRSQEYQVSAFMSHKEQEAMLRAQLGAAPNGKAAAGIRGLADKLGIKL